MNTARVAGCLAGVALLGVLCGVPCGAEEPARPEAGRTIAYLGIGTSPVNDTVARQLKLAEGTGLVVDYVDAEGPSSAILKPHDVLQQFNDQLLVSHEQLAVLVRSCKPGDKAELTVIREGTGQRVAVTLGEKPYTPLRSRTPGPVGFLPPSMNPFSSERDWRFNADSIRDMHEQIRQHFREAGKDDSFIDGILQGLADPFEDGAQATNRTPGLSGRIREEAFSQSSDAAGTSGTYTVVENGVTATLSVNGKDQQFRVTDAAGKVIFEGPVNTPDEIGKLPESVRKLYDRVSRTRGTFSRETQT